jgi:Ca2+-binding RTX toxin-like protein
MTTLFAPVSTDADPLLLADAVAPIVGTIGDDTLTGTAGDDTIIGGRGNDTLFGRGGNDTFIWNPGDGSDIVEGQTGQDTLVFNGSNVSETIAIAANGSRTLLTRDVAAIAMDIDGVETLHVATAGGTDRISVGDLRGTAVNLVEIDLGATADGLVDVVTVQGSAGDDTLGFTLGSSVVVNGLGAKTVVQNGEAIDIVRLDGGAGTDIAQTQGTTGDDTIGVTTDGAGNLVVFGTAGGPVVQTTAIEQVVIRGGGGNDTLTASNGIATLARLTLDGGAGDDSVRGGDGDDTLRGGDGNDVVAGGRGRDTATLGTGDDAFVWNPGDGSDVVEGNGGRDTLQFNGSNVSETVAIGASGAHAVLTRDIAAVTMDLHGMEVIDVRALGGTDTVVVGDLRGTDVREVHVDLSASIGGDDAAADTVTVAFTAGDDAIDVAVPAGAVVIDGLGARTFVENQGAGDRAVIDGGTGNDTATARGTAGDDVIGIAADGTNVAVFGANGPAVELTGVEQLVVRGGDGNDSIGGLNGIGTLTRLTIDGGAGDDTLRGGDGDDVVLGGSGNDIVAGGRGSDTATLGGGNDTFVWNPGDGSDAVEGGFGADTLQFNGSNASETFAIAANGTHAVLTRNIAAVTTDLHGMETLRVSLLGGDDQVTVGNLGGTDVAEVVLVAGSGNDTIDTRGLGTGGPHVVVDLSGFAAAAPDFATLLAHAHDDAGNAVLDLGDGNHLTLVGVDLASLQADDFSF